MTLQLRPAICSLSMLLLLAGATGAQAGTITPTISISPINSTAFVSDATVTLEIFADFDVDPTVGGEIDLSFSGSGFSFSSFTFSDFILNDTDPDFSGNGPAIPGSGDYSIAFGDFGGVGGDGPFKVGDLTFNLLAPGSLSVALSDDEAGLGKFFSASSFDEQTILYLGGSVDIQVIPIPASVWLFGSALGLLAGIRRRLSAS